MRNEQRLGDVAPGKLKQFQLSDVSQQLTERIVCTGSKNI
jgi:hypothetical protein